MPPGMSAPPPQPQAPKAPDQPPDPTQQPPIDDKLYKLRALVESTNIAEHLKEDQLREIGEEAKRGVETDLGSRTEWDRQAEKWTKLAIQTQEMKTFPWPGAANVKFPSLSTAAMQFAARAYPAMVPANGLVVSATVVGKDPDGSKAAQAERVSTYMSYQVMNEVANWEESMDKLLIMLPVVGVVFKKTYWCAVTEKICSEVILPKNLVVNYWTQDLCTTERISQMMELSPRIVKERMMSEEYLDVDLAEPPTPQNDRLIGGNTKNQAPANDWTTPYTFVEQHTYLDLDDDGYKEPYIVTFHYETGKVVRITARFDEAGIHHNEKGKLQKITPIEYFTKFGFIPNPDGSFYDMGFGSLLGPINEAINTILNQLIDAGTLSNLQSGFMGKGLRLKMGEARFLPGEWKPVNATGADLKGQILPLPVKEPSKTLFELMTSLINSGKELASIAEIFTGKMPGQNTPATTTMATVEQGMKVFTAIYKRLYRSLMQEFEKMYDLNGTYINPNTYAEVIGESIGPNDFKRTNAIYKVIPAADPDANSQQMKQQKAAALMNLLPTGVLDVVEVVKRQLDALSEPNPNALFNQAVQQTGAPPAPPPDPKALLIQQQMQATAAASQVKTQQAQQGAAIKQQSAQAQLAQKAQEAAIDQQAQATQASLENQAMQAKLQSKMVEGHIQTQAAAAQAQQTLVNNHQLHQQKMAHMRQQAAATPKPKGESK